jgi:hypothetical protein
MTNLILKCFKLSQKIFSFFSNLKNLKQHKLGLIYILFKIRNSKIDIFI